jgi:hypothetical protein
MALSSEQAPFTSEIVGSILAADLCKKSQSDSMLCTESREFSLRALWFPPTGKVVRVG